MFNLVLLIFFGIPPEIRDFLPKPGPYEISKMGDHTWTLNGPDGGYISDITYDNNFVYIGLLMNGVYWFQGNTWQPRKSGIEYASVLSILGAGPDTIFAGLDQLGLWQSTDGGGTWRQNSTIPGAVSINTIFQYDNNIFFVGTSCAGIYRSTDNGVNWSKINDPNLPDTLEFVSFTRDFEVIPTIYLGTEDAGIFISLDLGNTWIDYSEPDTAVNKLKYFTVGLNKYLYAGCNRGLYYQHLPALTWHQTVLFGIPVSDFTRKGDSLFVGTGGAGIFVGGIDDSIFQPKNQGLTYRLVNAIEVINDTILAGTCGGFFYSSNSGELWLPANQNLDANIIWDMETHPASLQSIYAVSFGGLYKSSDNGNLWQRYGNIPQYPFFNSLFISLSINPHDTSNMLIGTFFGLYRTVDNGQNWSFSADIGARTVSDIEIDPIEPNRVYATTPKVFFKSTNNGTDWSTAHTGMDYNDAAICPQAPETLYLATDQGVLKSGDYGSNFFEINNGLPSEPIARVNIDGYFPWLIYAGLEQAQAMQPALYRSLSGGTVWESTTFPEVSIAGIKTLKNVPFYLLANSSASRVHLSLNAGANWQDISPNLTGNMSPSIDFNPVSHTAFLGNLSGVYTYTDTTRPTILVSAPDSFSPDGDSIEDKIKFNITASDTHQIYYWRARIYYDTLLCRVMENFYSPDSVLWDGFSDAGVLQKNGLYKAQISVMDGFFNFDSASKFFNLNKKPMVSGVNWATASSQGRKISVDDSNRIHLVYVTYKPGEIFYTNSIDGINWTEPIDLSNTKNEFSVNPCIVVDHNNIIYVFWEEQFADSHEIVYQRCINGSWFNTPRRLTQTDGPSVNPSVVTTANNDLHLVWQEKSNNEIYYRRYNSFNGIWELSINLSQTSGISCDPFILAHNELYVFFSDNTNQPNNFDIRYRRFDGTNWLAESLLTQTSANSYLPYALADSLNQIHFFWVDSTPGNLEIFYKKFSPASGWGLDTNLSQTSTKSNNLTTSMDSLGNIYLFWEESGEIYRKIKDHQLGWLDSENLTDTLESSLYPSSSFQGDLVWTKGGGAPYKIVYYKEVVNTVDTISPQFTIFAPDTSFIGDTLAISFTVSENLSALPQSWLKDSLNDSLEFTITEDSSRYYSGTVLVCGLIKGMGRIIVTGIDLAGETGRAENSIYLNNRGALLPRDSCFAFPNPTRKDYVKFMCYLNQDAHLTIEIFTLAGRKIHTIEGNYDGGRLFEIEMSVQNLGTDIYIFRATATALVSSSRYIRGIPPETPNFNFEHEYHEYSN